MNQTVMVIKEQGPVKVLQCGRLKTYTVECAKCQGVQGVRTRREALATLKGHHRLCCEPVHQTHPDFLTSANVRAICGASNGTITRTVWDVDCQACIAARAEVR